MKKGVLVRSKRILLTFFAALLGLLTLFSYHNYAWYEEPIAKITAAEAVGADETIGAGQENYPIYNQKLTAVLMNGESKGTKGLIENN